MVLGHEWLHGLCLSLKHSYQHNTLTFDAHGAHVLLMGEQDVLASPLIFNAKLHGVINNNAINSLSLCYLLSPSLDSNVCVSEVSQVNNLNATSLIKSTPTKHHGVCDEDNNQLQPLLENFGDVCSDDLPYGLPLEQTIRMVLISCLIVSQLVSLLITQVLVKLAR